VDDKRLVTVRGDLTKSELGIAPDALKPLVGKISHVFHLGAIYDIESNDMDQQIKVNVDGTRHAIDFAAAVKAKCFHHVSSIAAAGLYRGTFTEEMFDEARNYDQPYFRTKHDSEALVRKLCPVPYRIYRPGIVVGHSRTGEISKIDGPYFAFKFLKKVRDTMPQWVPLIGMEGGRLNIVPVDYVADAMDYLAHEPDLNGRCFHLTDPKPYRSGEVLNIFAEAAGAPRFAMRIDYRMLDIIPKPLRDSILHLPPIQRIVDTILHDFGMPRDALHYMDYPTKFDARDTLRALKDSKIVCPDLQDYAAVCWDYWLRHLDPDLKRDHTLAGSVKGKVVVITGASSGIGRSAALRVAKAGAKTILVARSTDKLKEVQAAIAAFGGDAHIYKADVSDTAHCDRLIRAILRDHERVDILVNNAGRSIRRAIHNSYDRFHDFERTMQLNYFGAIRLILNVLPGMEAQGFGHVINVSSIGVLANAPRFSAYVASKAALDAFSRCARPEFLDKNVHFTTINMPLVKTPMISPTGMYDNVPTLDDAADMICQAIIERPKRIATRLGVFAQIVSSLAPKISDIVLHTAYKLFPESAAAMGKDKTAEQEVTTEAVAFASLMRGIHW
jgi:NAD(P)-dependent dehydrogenase (short-subunit alcohol dehydrogenase family)